MRSPLPVGDFQWLSEEEIEDLNWMSMKENQSTGYIVEVDLDYPDHLHDSHNSFPAAPERLTINREMLSEYAKGIKINGIKIFLPTIYFTDCQDVLHPEMRKKTTQKLGATFNPRRNYVTHYLNLQLWLKLGLRLKKVHRVLSFKQIAFLKLFVDYCTKKRKEALTPFEIWLWKLFINSNYGKMIEQTRDYIDAKFIIDADLCRKWISSPRFDSMKIISEEFVLIFLRRMKVFLNKPLAVGFTILEQSKRFMFESFYMTIRPLLPNCNVVMSDTDSFILQVRTKKRVDNLDRIKHIMDFSNYPVTHPRHDMSRKNQLGLFSHETKGRVIKRFAGLRSKTYAYVEEDELVTGCCTQNVKV